MLDSGLHKRLASGDGEAVTNEESSEQALFGHPGLSDGRQSEKAIAIARGARRQMHMLGFHSMTELTLSNGRRADIVALSQTGEIWILEIKSSVEDFRSDHKWPEYQEYADRLFFAVDADFLTDILPADTGLIIADRFGGEVIRMATKHTLAAARRKALTLRIARAACNRLHNLADPDLANDMPRIS